MAPGCAQKRSLCLNFARQPLVGFIVKATNSGRAMQPFERRARCRDTQPWGDLLERRSSSQNPTPPTCAQHAAPPGCAKLCHPVPDLASSIPRVCAAFGCWIGSKLLCPPPLGSPARTAAAHKFGSLTSRVALHLPRANNEKCVEV